MTTEGTCWPTHEQKLLLQAALLEGDPALDAWREWQARVDIDLVEYGSLRLLPLLYRNLTALAATDPQIGLYKGIYRQTWYQNQMRMHSLLPILRALNDAAIPTILLKGMALSQRYYRDLGLRPMFDLDLLVPTWHAKAAYTVLGQLGWKARTSNEPSFDEDTLQTRHATSLRNARDEELDLHWHAFFHFCYEGADEDFWQAARPLILEGVPTQILDPADQLLHLCAHGARWSPLGHVQWLADATLVLRECGDELDWGRLFEQAEKRRLFLPVRETLLYIKEALQAPVLDEIFDKMKHAPVSRLERMEFRTIASSPDGPLGWLPLFWFYYLRTAQRPSDGRLRARFLGFPRYLQRRWRMDHLWDVGLHVLSKGIQIVRRPFSV